MPWRGRPSADVLVLLLLLLLLLLLQVPGWCTELRCRSAMLLLLLLLLPAAKPSRCQPDERKKLAL